MAGHVEMIFSGVTALIPLIKSGRLRAIAIGSLKRFPSIPEVPTFDESGLKGFEAITWFGLMAPAKTPAAVIARWNSEVDRLLATAEMKTRFLNDGQETQGGPPEQFDQFIRAEIEKYAKVVKAAGIRQQ
ncbi:Tripartite tricarboxylate transporter family receptor [compost metagenome]